MRRGYLLVRCAHAALRAPHTHRSRTRPSSGSAFAQA